MVPSLARVAAWSAALLDAQFAALAVNAAVRATLESLHVALAAHLDDSSALAGLAGIVDALRKQLHAQRAAPPQRRPRAAREWAVEVLDLTVRE